MRRYALRDDQWDRIKDLLPGRVGHVGVTARDNRLFVDAVMYRYRAGIPWRDLPERYGPYTTAYNRYNRWAKAGVWLRIFDLLAERSPQSLALIDSSIIRAHQHAAGGKKGIRITPSAVLVED